MGNTTEISVRDILDKQFKYIKKYSNGCYGQLTLVESKTSFEKFALKEVISDNPKILTILKQRKQQSHANIINLVDYWVRGESSLCSNISHVYLLMEYQEMTLEDEIIERQLKQKYFSINEIKKIIQSSVAALSHLSKSKGNYHIGLQNTLVSSRCIVKVVEPDIMCNNIMSVEGQPVKRKYYLCEQPQLTDQQSQQDEKNQNGYKTKASVFYLGVMILSCCMLDQSFQQQIISNGSYDFQKLRQVSKSISDKYKKISPLIQKMVKKNPFKRPNFEQILSNLTPRIQKTRSIFEQITNTQ